MAELIEFGTERLCLRQWKHSDRESFAELNADPKVMAYFPTRLDRAGSDQLADRCAALIAERGWGLWAAETRGNGNFIGYVGLHVPNVELPFSPCVEVSWRLASLYWGQGYATEAARGALKVGFERLGLPEIVSFTTVHNGRSRAVMERLGMRKSAITFDHPAVPYESGLTQHCLYRLLREQWHDIS